ncbi:MAG: hypothetical protein C0501_30590 [Isosphaera sp.]|nr:hypothetical protein [Isosphaera sp.]
MRHVAAAAVGAAAFCAVFAAGVGCLGLAGWPGSMTPFWQAAAVLGVLAAAAVAQAAAQCSVLAATEPDDGDE